MRREVLYHQCSDDSFVRRIRLTFLVFADYFRAKWIARRMNIRDLGVAGAEAIYLHYETTDLEQGEFGTFCHGILRKGAIRTQRFMWCPDCEILGVNEVTAGTPDFESMPVSRVRH